MKNEERENDRRQEKNDKRMTFGHVSEPVNGHREEFSASTGGRITAVGSAVHFATERTVHAISNENSLPGALAVH